MSTYPWAAGYIDSDRPKIVTSRFQYDDGFNDRVLAFANNIRTVDGGTGRAWFFADELDQQRQRAADVTECYVEVTRVDS